MAVDLKGRVALVVGGASELGRHVVEALAESGARVFIGEAAIDVALNAALEIGSRFGSVSALRLDPAVESSWPQAIDGIHDEIGRLDLLVEVHPSEPTALLSETEPAHWQQVLDRQATELYLGLRAFLRVLPETGGVVLSLGSVGDPTRVAAAAGRAAALALLQTVAAGPEAPGLRLVGINLPTAAHRHPPAGLGDLVSLLCSDAAVGLHGTIVDLTAAELKDNQP